MNFLETKQGRQFFERQLPGLLAALTDIAAALKTPKPVYQLKQTVPEDFLADLYHGSYDPSGLPDTEREKALSPEIISIQKRLQDTVPAETWALIERYRWLLDVRGAAEREQAFAAGFRSAMTMLAAGLSQPAVSGQEVPPKEAF